MDKRSLQRMIGLIGIAWFLAIGAGVARQAQAQHAGHGAAPPAQSEAAKQPAEQTEEAEEAPTVEIPLDKQRMIGVKTVAAAVKPLRKTVRTVGRIEYDETRLATVNVKFEGWVEKLYADYVGKQVKRGEPLAELYSPELFATQQELINLVKWKGQGPETKEGSVGGMFTRDADALVEAARHRLLLWDITEKQIQAIAESGKPIRTLVIYSPVDGFVVQKAALQGMRVMPGEKLFDIADLSRVWIIADIYEYELPLIRLGDTAKITLNSFPGKEFAAVIDYVYPVLAGETRTVKVRLTLPNPGGLLKPQMFANVNIKTSLGSRLAIPEDALIDTGVRQVVYVDQGDGYFEHRVVTVGLRADGMVEILKGLKAGEKVASAAVFLIDSEAKLKGIVQ